MIDAPNGVNERLINVLPILAGLVLKLSSITFIPRVMMRALENLLEASRKTNAIFTFDEDQRELLIDSVSNEALKATAILSFFIADFDAAILLANHVSALRIVVFAGFSFSLVMALFPLWLMHPMQLSERSLFGLKRADLVIYSFCGIDVVLGTLSFLS